MPDDPSKPGYISKPAKKLLWLTLAYFAALVGFIWNAGELLGWWK